MELLKTTSNTRGFPNVIYFEWVKQTSLWKCEFKTIVPHVKICMGILKKSRRISWRLYLCYWKHIIKKWSKFISCFIYKINENKLTLCQATSDHLMLQWKCIRYFTLRYHIILVNDLSEIIRGTYFWRNLALARLETDALHIYDSIPFKLLPYLCYGWFTVENSFMSTIWYMREPCSTVCDAV